MRLVWRSWTHSEEDRKLAPLWGPFFAHLKWLVETVLKNKIFSCCPKGHGFVQLCWDSCLSERGDITWTAGCRQILASVNFCAILISIPLTADALLELIVLPVKVKLAKEHLHHLCGDIKALALTVHERCELSKRISLLKVMKDEDDAFKNILIL